jgi:hypothetical protein
VFSTIEGKGIQQYAGYSFKLLDPALQ